MRRHAGQRARSRCYMSRRRKLKGAEVGSAREASTADTVTDRNKQAGRRDSTHAKVSVAIKAHNFASLGKRLQSLTSRDPKGTLVGGRTWAKRRAQSSHRSVQKARPLHDTHAGQLPLERYLVLTPTQPPSPASRGEKTNLAGRF
jgi:hypothetical protein